MARRYNADSVGEIIAQQIGRRAFFMLGAKDMISIERGLTFKIRGSKKVNRIRITLQPSDTYKVEFFKERQYKWTPVAVVEDVYVDNLHRVIEKHTGLLTSLGTMGRTGNRKTHMNRKSNVSREHNLNDNDRDQWIDNDEGLYNWWKRSRMSKRAFMRENRAEIDAVINRVLHPKPREKTWRDYNRGRAGRAKAGGRSTRPSVRLANKLKK